jgi:hypothetical protein
MRKLSLAEFLSYLHLSLSCYISDSGGKLERGGSRPRPIPWRLLLAPFLVCDNEAPDPGTGLKGAGFEGNGFSRDISSITPFI